MRLFFLKTERKKKKNKITNKKQNHLLVYKSFYILLTTHFLASCILAKYSVEHLYKHDLARILLEATA